MKSIRTALLLVFLLSFSFGQAQERVTTKTKRQAATNTTAILNPNLTALQRAMVKPVLKKEALKAIQDKLVRNLIEKINASNFEIINDGYPSELDQPRNGNEAKLILHNNNGVYRILYRTNESKEVAYYKHNNTVKSEYELFSFLMAIDDYETVTNPNAKTVELFNEVGVKRLGGAAYLGLEENSVGVLKATYEGDIYAYTDGRSWLRNGTFVSSFSGQ